MVPSLAVLKKYLYVKKEFLACSSRAIKQVCLPVWEAPFLTFELSVLVGAFVPFDLSVITAPTDLNRSIQALKMRPQRNLQTRILKSLLVYKYWLKTA